MSIQPAGEPRSDTCTNCGAEQNSEFCPRCGERRLRPDEYSLRRLVVDWSRDAVSFDSKWWRSFRTLVLEPGRLTAEYMAGRRARSLSPVQIFLTANLIYFVVQPYTGFNGFNTPLESHMNRQLYSDVVRVEERVLAEVQERVDAGVAAAIAAREESEGSVTVADSIALAERVAAVQEAVYPNRFNATGAVYARAMVFLIIPMLVLVLWITFLGTGAPFVKHVVFATHLHAWDLVFVYSLVLPLLRVALRLGFSLVGAVYGLTLAQAIAHPLGSMIYSLIAEQGSLIVVFAYVTMGLRTAYEVDWVGAASRAAIITVASLFVAVAFRLVLFSATYLST